MMGPLLGVLLGTTMWAVDSPQHDALWTDFCHTCYLTGKGVIALLDIHRAYQKEQIPNEVLFSLAIS